MNTNRKLHTALLSLLCFSYTLFARAGGGGVVSFGCGGGFGVGSSMKQFEKATLSTEIHEFPISF